MQKTVTQYFCLIILCLPMRLLAKQKILIIESYHSNFAWDISYKQGIRSVLKDNFELHYFPMNTKRIPQSAYQEKADQAWNLFQQTSPDLVILGDDNAVQYLSTRFAETATPIIYLGLNNNPRNYNIHRSRNISGVLERPLLKRAIPSVARILPGKVTQVLVMFDNSRVSNTIIEEAFAGKTQMRISGIAVDIKQIGKWSDWQSTLLSAAEKSYDAVFLGLFHTINDSKGKHVPEELVLKWSSENTPVPPFGFWDYAIGQHKNIGGLVTFGHEQGKIAAEMAQKVLVSKVQPYQLGTKTAEKGRYLFSRTALQKYGLILPENIAQKTTYID